MSNIGQKHIFFVSYFFPPINRIACDRALKYVAVLCNQGNRVTVITVDSKFENADFLTSFDRSTVLNPNLLRIVRLLPNCRSLLWPESLKSRLGVFVSKALRRVLILTKLVSDFEGVCWNGRLKRHLYSLVKEKKPDLMIYSAGPHYSMKAVASIGKQFDIPYILDYRDLWLDNPYNKPRGISLYMSRRVEKEAVLNSKAIVCVSHGLLQQMRQHYPAVPGRIMYNLPDQSYRDYIQSLFTDRIQLDGGGDAIHLFYAGVIYTNGDDARSFAPVLQALKTLDEKLHSRFIFHYVGSNGAIVEAQFKSQGFLDKLRLYGRLDKKDVFRYMHSADVLLSLVNLHHSLKDVGRQGVMTTKVFDYMIIGKPILNISSINAELNHFFDKIKYKKFYSYSAKQQIEIAKCLNLFAEKKSNDKPFFNASYLEGMPGWESQFSANMADLMIE